MRNSAPRLATALLVQALALLSAGCGGGDGSTPTPAPAPTPTPSPPGPTPAGPGLDSRPTNTTCLAGDAPGSSVSLAVQRVFPNLPNFTQPVAMLQEPGNSARWYVVQKTGQVKVFDNTSNVSTTRTFIDISSKLNSNAGDPQEERGLLGMAFHPNYPTDPRVYLYYTGSGG